jgi:hypothetical protein
MTEEIKHIVIVRLALKWRYKELNKKWDEWLENSIYLMDKYCRPSLLNQKNKNFDILTLVDSCVNYYGNKLDNEYILKFDSENDLNTIWEGYKNCQMIKTINDHVYKNYKNYNYVLLTRLDRDDIIRYDFLENVRKNIKIFDEQYIDTNMVYHLKNDIIYKCDKYIEGKMISPFVSTLEKIENGKIKCYPFFKSHTETKKFLNGLKFKNLNAIQVLHDNNFSNTLKNFEELNNIKIEDYGIKKQ